MNFLEVIFQISPNNSKHPAWDRSELCDFMNQNNPSFMIFAPKEFPTAPPPPNKSEFKKEKLKNLEFN